MYIVEGTIGAGKSTFLKLLGRHMPDISVKLEQVDTWQSQEYGQSLLANFYKDPKRWAYTFEAFTLICRVQEHIQEQKNKKITLLERSIYSGNYVFAKNSYESGFMNECEWIMYNQWFSFLSQGCQIPEGFIYLKIDPKVAYERVKKRNRSAESTLPIEYLYHIGERHEEFLCKKENIHPSLKDVPVLVIDCNQEFEEDTARFRELCARVREFFNKKSEL